MRTALACLCALLASPALAVDDCLEGRWQVDTGDIARVLADQMSAAASYVSGGVTMQIARDGAITMLVRDLTITVEVADVPPMDVVVNGASRGSLTAENGGWTLTVTDYSLEGSANVMGSELTIPFNAASGMFGGGSGSYACDGDLLTFDSLGPSSRLPRRWSRAR